MAREREAAIANRRTHAIATLTNACIRKTHHAEERQAEANIHFHVNGVGVDAEHRRTLEASEHTQPGANETPLVLSG
jgi:hypothetical protein